MNRPHTVVVGGTYGGGRALVRRLSRQGHSVSVIGRRAPAEADRRLPNVRFWRLDLSNTKRLPAACERLLAWGGKLDSLVFYQRYRGTGDAWSGELSVSLTATKTLIETLAQRFSAGGGKSIVVVGSVGGQLVATEQPVGYHVAKAGLVQMVRYYAATLGPLGVRVNAVSPGTVLKEESAEFYRHQTKLLALYRRIIPLGRMGNSTDVANVVEFLCGPQAAYVTGQNIVVDGGLSLQWQESLSRGLMTSAPRKITRSSAQEKR